MTTHITDLEIDYFGFNSLTREDFEEFDRMFPHVETKSKATIGTPDSKESRVNQPNPHDPSEVAIDGSEKPIDYRPFAELILNKPIERKLVPSGGVVGNAAQLAPVRTPNFQSNSPLAVLSALLRGAV